MRSLASVLGLALLLGCSLPLPAAESYRIDARPAWVTPVEAGAVKPELLNQAADGVYYLLSDMQVRLDGEQGSRYRRVVAKALTAKGLESLANLEFEFDPSHEELILNSVSVIRKGRVIPKLKDAEIRILQRETELDYLVFDGSMSANIFLEDVRVGDLVDYEYTVVGRNPVFAGRDFGAASLEYSVPVARIHVRLLHPETRPLQWASRPKSARPSASKVDGQQQLVWDLRDVPARHVDSDSPGWYDPYAAAYWSEYPNWADVVNWALPLYAVPKPNAELQEAIDEIKRDHADSAARTQAALNYVQSEIRYMAVSLGAGSHAPNAPDVVLKRRFGDCKDKTLLLLTMLRQLGIDANPALVNTSMRRGLRERLASPGVFDHVLVQARVDGQTYWLDPTRMTQKGQLADIHQPDYDLALPLKSGSRGLVAMGDPAARVARKEVRVQIDARAGFDQAVGFTVTTTSKGALAERARADLADTGSEEMQRSFLKFYAGYYPGIRVLKPIDIEDRDDRNEVRVTEHYEIDEYASWSEEKQRFIAPVKVPDLNEYLRSEASPARNAPLRLGYPQNIQLTTKILLPVAFSIKPETERVDDPAFSLVRSIQPKGTVLTIVDEWTSKTDEISAAETPRYLKNLRAARELVGYELYWNKESRSRKAPAADAVTWPKVLCSLGFAWLCP
ncbi:MAG: DUF3857 domain-containing protein [Lysobacterales bacterium]